VSGVKTFNTMATSIPTWATISPIKIKEGLGEPIRCKLSSGLTRIKKPLFDEHGITLKQGFFQIEGRLALVLEPHLGGTRWWLCCSWNLDQSTTADWSDHELLLRADESTDCKFLEIEKSLRLSSRWAVSRIQFIDFRITHAHMKELSDHIGGFKEEGRSFFERLLPGNLPSAVRVSPNNWQVWIQL